MYQNARLSLKKSVKLRGDLKKASFLLSPVFVLLLGEPKKFYFLRLENYVKMRGYRLKKMVNCARSV